MYYLPIPSSSHFRSEYTCSTNHTLVNCHSSGNSYIPTQVITHTYTQHPYLHRSPGYTHSIYTYIDLLTPSQSTYIVHLLIHTHHIPTHKPPIPTHSYNNHKHIYIICPPRVPIYVHHTDIDH